MQRTVTVVAAATGAVADVRLRVDGGVRVSDVLPDLRSAAGVTTGDVTLDARPLDPRTPVRELPEGAVLTLGTFAAAPTPAAAPALALGVTSGPGAGRTLALAPGVHVLGREAPLCSDDAAVSRRHAEVTVAADGSATVADLDSRNGSTLGGLPLTPGAATPWPAGTALRIGTTTLVHARPRPPAATAPAPCGHVTVTPPPRLRDAADPRTVRFPRAPEPAEPARLPLLASVAPLVAGLVLAVLLHRWEFAAFALMSPLVVLGQAVADRRATGRRNRAAAAAHATATAAAEAELAAALHAEVRARHEQAPDLAELVAAATERTALLWQRRAVDADAFTVRLGLGDLPPATTVEGGPLPPTLRDVPVCVDLRRTTTVGVRAAGDTAVGIARTLVVQLAALHGPASLQLVALAPGRASRWAWLRWLPHVRGGGAPAAVATTAAQVRVRLDELAAPPVPGQHTVVVVDGVHDTAVAGRLAARAQTSVLWVARDGAPLPPGCEVVVEPASDEAGALTVQHAGAGAVVVAPDLVAADVAETFARALAPLRDASTPAAASLPAVVRWSSLHDIALGDLAAAAATLERAWRAGPTTMVTIGMGETGPARFDLQADGPHLLVAGTTGAGKSELLQTIVASLVAGNSPADLNLLLVDFKGGAAFGSCAELPHTIGVLTDLDPAATTRALASLSAELRRRERLFADAGVVDVDGWRSTGRPPLARLVIVVDEFATLADELPDFLGGLVGIAQRGRSLGIHLVLATQRPEGAVSADIRANTRLRICLAVAREAESRDVIDSPLAVAISRSTPGRALVRIGAHDLREVQTARVAAPWQPHARRVEVVPLPAWGEPPPPPAAMADVTDLDLLVAAARAAAAGAAASEAPWLPPLPDVIGTAELTAPTPGAVGVALVDLPHEQRQPVLDLAIDGADPLLVVGGPRSGRTTTVITLVTALAAAVAPDDLHVFAIDSGRGLSGLADLPHTGAVVDVRDLDRVERLLAHLLAEVERRRDQVGDDARLLLVVDSWDGLAAATGDVDGGRCQETLLRLLAAGGSAGLRVVVTSDRSGLSGRLGSSVADKLCLRLPDRADYALLGVPARQVPGDLPAGRGIRTSDQAWLQVAVTDEATRSAARRWAPPARPARRFDPLPQRVPLHAVAQSAGVVVGIRSDDLAPLVLDPAEAGVLLVAGPPGSGRSTTLVSLAAQLHDRTVVAMCPRRGPMRSRRDLALVTDPADGDALDAALRALDDGAALLVDDIDLVDDPRALDAIEAAVRRGRDGAGFVALAGATDAMTAAFRGPVAQARRSRCGLLLRPEGPHDGELLGLRLRRRSGAGDPPGRGILAVDGVGVPVQVPDPA